MAQSLVLHAYVLVLFIINTSLSSHPFENLASNLCTNNVCIEKASSDYGNIVKELPSAVLYPSSVSDITHLVKSSYNSSSPFPIAARGHGHSIRGQAMARDGVVVEMTSLNSRRGDSENIGIRVSWSSSLGFYADVGGEQLWIDVLQATMERGLAPVSWTDYLYLSVGGTISNAGVSGQSFLHGPQISNVHEMDVITGKGVLMTCSKKMNSDLFYGVLGGLGQFGIITRARIVLDKAPNRVKWVRMVYEDFSNFTKDQEYLISINGVDYVEGSLILNKTSANNWRSSFYSPTDALKVNSLASKHGILYSLEVVKYYDDYNMNTVDEELETTFKVLNFKSGFIFKKDLSFFKFLNRVRNEELKLRSKGRWDVPHPWLNLFVPRSQIMEFNQGVFVEIIQKQSKSSGPFLVYPINRKMWDDRMSVIIPDEDDDEDENMFYSVGLLHSTGIDAWMNIDEQNNEILEFCFKFGIKIKQYLPHYKKKEQWMKHFGKKWRVFEERKAKFDPKMILSPGQRIFNYD